MKTFQVTVYRRSFTTYEVEVEDDFDATEAGFDRLYFASGGSDWLEVDVDVANFEIDSFEEV